ncbi:MAG: GAF domain-containing sensor histidine kinase [Anaerolineales bacterium]
MLLTREQLQERLIALHKASLELIKIKEVSLETLLERIVALACEQAGARYAALGVLDDEGRLKRFITVGMTPDEIKRIPHPPRGLGLIGALMHSEENIRLAEIADDPRSIGFPPGHAKMHSFLGVPIRLGNRQLGQIYLTEKKDAPEFTPDDEKIIEMLAAYAGIAIQNARLYNELQQRDRSLTRRTEELALINHIGAALADSLELDEILDMTLSQLLYHFKVEAGEIFLLDEDGHTLRLMLHRGEAAEAFWARNRFKIGEGVVGHAAATRKPVIVTDLERQEDFTRQAIVEAGFRQIACIPLIGRGELAGVLTIATRSEKVLEENEVQLLTSIAAAAGTAIENARLHINARRLAVLEERQRIGMDLHDGVIQSIYGAGLALENARLALRENVDEAEERIRKVIDDLNRTIADIRAYILDLQPRQLGSENLVEGLRRLLAEFRQNTQAQAVLTSPRPNQLQGLPLAHATALFHICQEALANAAKHARASKVSVDLWLTSDRVLLEVRDNGKGFNVEKARRTVGHGLSNMMARVHSVGGDLEITSVLGEGTTILAWVPRTSAPRGV